MAMVIIASAMGGAKAGIVISWLVLLPSAAFSVGRLHDAGHSGFWELPVLALAVASLIASAKAGGHISDEEAVKIMLPFIGNLIGFIVICALPSKLENNPWR